MRQREQENLLLSHTGRRQEQIAPPAKGEKLQCHSKPPRSDSPCVHEQALFTPIRRRLVAWTVLVVSVLLLVLGTSIYVMLSQSLMDQVDHDLITRNAHPGGSHDGYTGGTFVVSLSSSGQPEFNPQQVQLDTANLPGPTPGGTLATVTVNGEPTRIFVSRAPDGDTLISGQRLQPMLTATQTLLFVLVAGGALGLLLTVWAGGSSPAARWFPSRPRSAASRSSSPTPRTNCVHR